MVDPVRGSPIMNTEDVEIALDIARHPQAVFQMTGQFAEGDQPPRLVQPGLVVQAADEQGEPFPPVRVVTKVRQPGLGGHRREQRVLAEHYIRHGGIVETRTAHL
mgnify:CR=1 FL=1